MGKVFRGNFVRNIQGVENSLPDLIVTLRLVDRAIKVVQFLPAQEVLHGGLREGRNLSGKSWGQGNLSPTTSVLPIRRQNHFAVFGCVAEEKGHVGAPVR